MHGELSAVRLLHPDVCENDALWATYSRAMLRWYERGAGSSNWIVSDLDLFWITGRRRIDYALPILKQLQKRGLLRLSKWDDGHWELAMSMPDGADREASRAGSDASRGA